MNRWIARLLALVLTAAALYLVYANVHAGSILLESTLAAAVLAIATVLLAWKRPIAALILNVIWLGGAFGVSAYMSPSHQMPSLVATSGNQTQSAPIAAASTSAAVPAAEPSSEVPGANVVAEAKRLGNDPAALLGRVASVRYEIYPGVFRGAAATLDDDAGNDYDRALLLHDLLAAGNAGAVRYAFCSLNDQQRAAAVASARKSYVAPSVAASADELAAKASRPQARDGFTNMASFWRAASAQAHAQTTELASDFQKAGAVMTVTSPGDAASTVSDHVWIQLQSGGNWIDLDPSLPNAKLGATECVASKTADALPNDSYDTASLALHLESRQNGNESDTTIATGTWRTADLAGAPLIFAFAESSGLQAPAPQPTGMRAYTPLLVAGPQIIAAPPIVVPAPVPGTSVVKAASKGSVAGASGALQAFGSAPPVAATPAPTPSGPVPVALRLDVTVTEPNGPPTTVERPIFDRVSASDRAANRAATTPLSPMTLLPFGTVWNVAVNLGTGVAGAGDTSQIDPKSDDPAALNRVLGRMHRAYYALRRALFADAVAPPVPVVTVKPGISFLGLAPYAAGPYPFGLAMDRASEGAVPDGGGQNAGLAWGVASVYAERLAVGATAMMKRKDSLDVLPFDDTIEMFYIARHSNDAPKIVSSSGDVAALPAPDDAKARLVASLGNGVRAVVPSAPVSYGGSNDYGWWTLGLNGTVSDEMQSGMHQEAAEEGAQEEEVVEEAPSYRKSGFIVRCIGLAAGAMMAIAAAGGGEGSSEIAEQLAEHIHAIYEANEAEEMMEAANECNV